MKKFMNMVSALALVVGLTASQASFAEFLAPPIMPMGGCATCSIGAFPPVSPFGMAYGSHGMFSPFGYPPYGYGMYRHGYFGYGYRGFLGRGGCGWPYRSHHHFACGRGRRSFRSFSISIGGFFNFSSVRF